MNLYLSTLHKTFCDKMAAKFQPQADECTYLETGPRHFYFAKRYIITCHNTSAPFVNKTSHFSLLSHIFLSVPVFVTIS